MGDGSVVHGRQAMLIAASFLIAGLILGSYALSPYLARGAGNPREGLNVEGYVTVRVMNPDGTTASTWKGYNFVVSAALSAIAQCLGGNGSAPAGYQCSSGWTTYISIYNTQGLSVSDIYSVQKASNTLTPVGCGPFPSFCTGWIAEATFGPSTFTKSNCSGGCTVGALVSTTAASSAFDEVYTSISVNQGDSLLVSIQFTVT